MAGVLGTDRKGPFTVVECVYHATTSGEWTGCGRKFSQLLLTRTCGVAFGQVLVEVDRELDAQGLELAAANCVANVSRLELQYPADVASVSG